MEVGSRGNVLGYWEYLPTTYESESDRRWPVLIYLAGVSSVGTGMDDSPCPFPLPPGNPSGQAGLCNLLAGQGVHTVIHESLQTGVASTWPEEQRPFVVISPQNPNPGDAYPMAELNAFVQFVLRQYPVDERRLYLLGHSQGGRSVLQYLERDPDRFAAAVVMPGGEVDVDPCALGNLGLWAFHGERDVVPAFEPDGMTRFVEDFNACPMPRPPARLTVYLQAPHQVWVRTYRPEQGMGAATDPVWNPYDVDLYDWLWTFERPAVEAGNDIVLLGGGSSVDLQATVQDDDAVTWFWSQVGGEPTQLQGVSTPTPTVTGLHPGDYEYEVLVLDGDGLSATDTVRVYVADGGDGDTGGRAYPDGTASPAGSGSGSVTTGSSHGSITEGLTDPGLEPGQVDRGGLVDEPTPEGCICQASSRQAGPGLALLLFGLGFGLGRSRRASA